MSHYAVYGATSNSGGFGAVDISNLSLKERPIAVSIDAKHGQAIIRRFNERQIVFETFYSGSLGRLPNAAVKVIICYNEAAQDLNQTKHALRVSMEAQPESLEESPSSPAL
jgi:hypothetical protein